MCSSIKLAKMTTFDYLCNPQTAKNSTSHASRLAHTLLTQVATNMILLETMWQEAPQTSEKFISFSS